MNSLSYKKGPCAQSPKKVGPFIPVSEGQGFYGPFDKVKRPRISKAQYRADGTLSYVDLGAGKREWSMVILARNDLLRYDGVTTGVSGEQDRDNLLNSYVNNIATTISFTDPKSSSFNVYFLHFEETIIDLKS